MAFPVVQTGDTQSNGETSNSTTHTVTYCTNIAKGDRLILVFIAASSTITDPGGWTLLSTQGPTPTMRIYEKIAAGGETGTFSISTSSSVMCSYLMYRITGAHPTQSPVGPSDTGTSTSPDSSSLDPAGWAIEDVLWLAICGYADGTTTISAFPSGFTNTLNVRGNNASGVGLGIATLASAVSSEDPAAYTISASKVWRARTVAIRPNVTPSQFDGLMLLGDGYGGP